MLIRWLFYLQALHPYRRKAKGQGKKAESIFQPIFAPFKSFARRPTSDIYLYLVSQNWIMWLCLLKTCLGSWPLKLSTMSTWKYKKISFVKEERTNDIDRQLESASNSLLRECLSCLKIANVPLCYRNLWYSYTYRTYIFLFQIQSQIFSPGFPNILLLPFLYFCRQGHPHTWNKTVQK